MHPGSPTMHIGVDGGGFPAVASTSAGVAIVAFDGATSEAPTVLEETQPIAPLAASAMKTHVAQPAG